MVDYEIKKDIPRNIEELKKKANNKSSWRSRLEAVQELRSWDCPQSRDIITRLAIHDLVFTVKEEACRAAQRLEIKKNGKPIFLGKKSKGNLMTGINKKLEKVRNSFVAEFMTEDFKTKFKELYPVEYDTYEGDKGKSFDKWLENVIKSLPKKNK